MIRWAPASCENLAAPDRVLVLLQRAIAAAPDQAALRLKLGNLHFDRFDFIAASAAFEAAVACDPDSVDARIRLARCCNVLSRFKAALDALAALTQAQAHYERGVALAGLSRPDEAEREFRAALAADPGHRRACMKLCAVLRNAGRTEELLAQCEDLAAHGVDHAQLLLDWGRVLALTGDTARARRLLFDPARVTQIDLPPPFASFNTALAEELLGNPFALSEFPTDEEANRGSSRVHNLLSGRRPERIRTLLAALQTAVAAHAPTPYPGFDPWTAARPAAAHLKPWGLIQHGGDHEAWHTHRGGWLSGVYYVRVPDAVSADGEGRGCIEFGPPRALREAMPDLIGSMRIAPRPGLLLLAPSHYHHRTIPTGVAEPRVSFAFDVVPEG